VTVYSFPIFFEHRLDARRRCDVLRDSRGDRLDRLFGARPPVRVHGFRDRRTEEAARVWAKTAAFMPEMVKFLERLASAR